MAVTGRGYQPCWWAQPRVTLLGGSGQGPQCPPAPSPALQPTVPGPRAQMEPLGRVPAALAGPAAPGPAARRQMGGPAGTSMARRTCQGRGWFLLLRWLFPSAAISPAGQEGCGRGQQHHELFRGWNGSVGKAGDLLCLNWSRAGGTSTVRGCSARTGKSRAQCDVPAVPLAAGTAHAPSRGDAGRTRAASPVFTWCQLAAGTSPGSTRHCKSPGPPQRVLHLAASIARHGPSAELG